MTNALSLSLDFFAIAATVTYIVQLLVQMFTGQDIAGGISTDGNWATKAEKRSLLNQHVR